MPEVSLIQCSDYTLDDLKDKIRISFSNIGFDADIILNLPKFKTHGITYMTVAQGRKVHTLLPV